MAVIKNIVQFILDLGGSIMLPFMVLLLGLYFRMKFVDALKSGITIGVGFIGINLMIDLLIKTIAPITEYYTKLGTGFTVINIGWDGVAAMAWSTSFAVFIVPLGFILNFILIRTKFTKTLNVDIWNYYSPILTAAIAYYLVFNLGGSAIFANSVGILIGLICTVIACKIGDWVAPYWQEYFNMPEGTTCTTFDIQLTHWPISRLGAWIYDHIPGLNKVNFTIDSSKGGLSSWGSSTVIGFFMGIFLSIITRQDVGTMLSISVGISAVLTLMPQMVSLLMNGLVPISNAARAFIVRKLGEDSEILIGMDVSIGLGDSCGMTTSLILIPIVIIIAFIVPGISFFPVGLFGSMVWIGQAAAFAAKGNLPKAIFSGTFFLIYACLALSLMAGVATTLAYDLGIISEMSPMVTGSGFNMTQIVLLGIIGKITGAF